MWNKRITADKGEGVEVRKEVREKRAETRWIGIGCVLLTDLLLVLAVYLCLVVLNKPRAEVIIYRVTGASMEPSYSDGEYVYVKLCDFNDENDVPISTGQVVVVETPLGILIKRVAGVAGELVAWESEAEWQEVAVKEGYVFLMGDNGSASMDSRSELVDQVPVENIVGIVQRKLPHYLNDWMDWIWLRRK